MPSGVSDGIFDVSRRGMKLGDMIKKADIVLFAILVLLGLSALLVLRSGGPIGSTVEITVDGEKYGSYPLNVDAVIDVDTEYGHNQVTISAGTVCITESDCFGHDCEGFGKISRVRQSIMCLPHRLIVTISGKSDVDIVVY